MATQMLQRRGTAAELAAENRILGPGEIAVEENSERFKIGDGVTPWNDLDLWYITKQEQDATYLPRNVIDAEGDLLVGTADNTAGRLGKGAPGQRLTIQPDGTLAWADLPVGANPFAVIDALGDLLVGSGPDAVARLPKGANGTVLTIKPDGTVGWQAATAVDASKLAKAGDTMTGELVLARADSHDVLMLRSMTDNAVVIRAETNGPTVLDRLMFWNADTGGTLRVDAKAFYDDSGRVYSPGNPPPPSGAMINQTIRGSVAIPGGSTVTASSDVTASYWDVGIPSVNMAKSQLRNNGSFSNMISGTQWSPALRMVLVGSTTIRFYDVSQYNSGTGNYNHAGAWGVYEITEWS